MFVDETRRTERPRATNVRTASTITWVFPAPGGPQMTFKPGATVCAAAARWERLSAGNPAGSAAVRRPVASASARPGFCVSRRHRARLFEHEVRVVHGIQVEPSDRFDRGADDDLVPE